MSFVIFVNGLVLLFMAALMAVLTALFPATATIFGEAALLAGTAGALLAIAGYGPRVRLHRLHAFLLTASVWLTAALAGALPLWMWNLSLTDAIFEAMSGITTTGSTVMTGLDTTERGILFWRALLQAIGGVGFIVTGMALLPQLRIGGMQLFRTESSDRSEPVFGTIAAFATKTLQVYLGLIFLCFTIYLVGGMSIFDAITHAMTTVSSGGYSNYDASFGHFQNPFLHWAATAFMLLAALPFAWYIRALTSRHVLSEQVGALLTGLAVVIGVLTFWRVAMSDVAPLTALREVAFNVISVVSTTGYATTDYTLWGSFAAAAFFVLTALGGCTGSTAGGAKTMRWIVFARGLSLQIQRLYHPHSMTSLRYEGRALGDDVVLGVISFFTFYFATFGIVAVLLGFVGLDFLTATSGALTALANVGPGVGDVIGPAGNFAGLNDSAKVILSFAMYAGRLEMLTVFVLFTRRFWAMV